MEDTRKEADPDGVKGEQKNPCGCAPDSPQGTVEGSSSKEGVCCPSGQDSTQESFELPGYQVMGFVEGFLDTPAGRIPRVRASLKASDILGTIKTRMAINRDQYRIAPGLYGVGKPGPQDPVLVTANYKLSFDTLRKELASINAWVLVLETNGVNVWCAAGKGTFSTEEVIQRVVATGLDRVVEHRHLVLPQLSATGVSAQQVKKGCGFRVHWGPVFAKDIIRFLESGMKADKEMRRVTFSLAERTVLVPVELSLVFKYLFWVLLAAFLFSGIGSNIFSLHAAWERGLMIAGALAGGILAGAVATPILLPWIPGRAFSLKGTITGLIAGVCIILAFWGRAQGWETLALLLFTAAMSSFLAMNFTGATPFTSPSGVEKEMRKAIPIQVGAILIAIVAWVGSGFSG